MGSEFLALVASYFLCSEAAKVQMLEQNEIAECSAIYTEVKLSFVPDVDLALYLQMDVDARVAINGQGYGGYVDWRKENPELVADMEADARLKLGISRNWNLFLNTKNLV